MTDTTPSLTSFLLGKFNRTSLYDVLDGMTIADISGIDMPDFLNSLDQKDRLLGVRLWADVLLPVRNAWQELKYVEPGYVAAQRQLMNRIAEISARLTNTDR